MIDPTFSLILLFIGDPPYVHPYFHEFLFGSLLANLLLLLSTIRFIYRVYHKYKNRIDNFFDKMDILWKDYGNRKYPRSVIMIKQPPVQQLQDITSYEDLLEKHLQKELENNGGYQ